MVSFSFPVIAIPIIVTIVCLSFIVFRPREQARDWGGLLVGFFELLVDVVAVIPTLVAWMGYFAWVAYSK